MNIRFVRLFHGKLLTEMCMRVTDTQRCLQAVERLQARLKERGGDVPSDEKLNLLKSVLQSPLFHQILALQKSVQHLKEQVRKPHYPRSCPAFHIPYSGQKSSQEQNTL